MNKLKIPKRKVDAYEQFKREELLAKTWQVTKKVLFSIGIAFFFLLCAIFYFAKICIKNK